jgi:ankyrin repeat protein
MPVGEDDFTPLHDLATVADPFDYSTHENQLVLAKDLIEHGANVNAVSVGNGRTPLQEACHAGSVTNLDFVELLLKEGADPNSKDHLGLTPLMYTLKAAPGAVKVLLNWPTTDVNILSRSGESFLAMVRRTITYFSEWIAFPDNPERVQHQFQLQQWREIEELLLERSP